MTARPRSARLVPVVVAGAVLASFAACGGDDGGDGDDGGSGDFTVQAALADLPESALEDSYIVTVGDLDRASELAGATRPDPDADADATIEWLKQIDGVFADDDDDEWPVVAALFPEAAGQARIGQVDEFRDELGWTLLDISWFAEVQAPPSRFSVLHGEFDTDTIDRALGERDDEVWSIGGDDFEVDVSSVSAARPLGESLRFAEDDGALAVSRSTPPMEDWLGGDDRLDTDEDLAAVAEALDEHDVYTAMLFDGDSMTYHPGIDVPDEIAEQLEGTLLADYDALGAGLTVVDDEPVGVLAYQHASEDDAEENAALLEELFDSGTSFRSLEPLSDLFPDAEVSVDGTIVTVTVRFEDGRAVNLWNAIQIRESFVTHE